MTKKQTLFISFLLLTASILIEILVATPGITLDIDLIEFFAGLLFGIGIVFPVKLLTDAISKRKKSS
ncbi:hypothetical protein KDU71_07875 [Carboxylicivirga sediminis]|uniref:Uncharacterized protein n=1 Tax=Carboxylicivirga sediminis TaxID=2006564 RepID=A0A941F2A4_9BACT|nr:hypothetical protein [Carboxylicivirga sediminis]MBR8535473.1 hypothetical protein [Carboxylicivirga sediminis]